MKHVTTYIVMAALVLSMTVGQSTVMAKEFSLSLEKETLLVKTVKTNTETKMSLLPYSPVKEKAAIRVAQAEVCDGIDNDLDGSVDEGLQYCVDGTIAEAEVCDGYDNDRDGYVDDGLEHCVDGVMLTPEEETCDGVDNDLDGEIDEGVLYCVNGVIGSAETCDGVDNDLDGEVDEGLNAYVCVDGVIVEEAEEEPVQEASVALEASEEEQDNEDNQYGMSDEEYAEWQCMVAGYPGYICQMR